MASWSIFEKQWRSDVSINWEEEGGREKSKAKIFACYYPDFAPDDETHNEIPTTYKFAGYF